jgi:hypothetical protein
MSIVQRSAVMAVSLVVSSVLAGPKIEFDTKAFKCGDVVEGKTQKLNATFNVKNTGDALLKLTSVRPGCGCTVVKFDSLIEPGKTAKIEAVVNIANYHSGQISKAITVTSNAENEANTRLTIEATVMAVIEVSESTINLDCSDTAKAKTVTLSSKKADLKVSEVMLKMPDGSNTPEWRREIPMAVRYSWSATDSTRADGYHLYTLTLYPPKADKGGSGDITVKTNHPDKQELTIHAVIVK